jgi:hypothetical protein
MVMASTENTMLIDKRQTFIIPPGMTNRNLRAHGIIMSICFVVLFPLFAITLYLVPYSKRASRIHAPLQLITLILTVVGLGLGVDSENALNLNGEAHFGLGIAVVVLMLLIQPAMGYLQHRYFKKNGSGSSIFGHVHRWFGRIAIILGIVDGGLGLQLARKTSGDDGASWGTVIAYIVVASVIAFLYVCVVLLKKVILTGTTGGGKGKRNDSHEIASDSKCLSVHCS